MRKVFARLLFGFPLLLLPLSHSLAFDKDVHVEVTEKIIEQYNRCAVELGKPEIGSPDGAEVARYAMMEDEKPLITRALNWHFYDALRDTRDRMPRRLLLARTQMHHIYDVRVRKLYRAINEDNQQKINRRTGRVLHYIEDMGVPAHVAPIYHAAPGDGWLQKLMVKNEPDMFDSMPVRYKEKLTYQVPLEDCKELDTADRTLEQIMVDMAEDTRAAIRRPLVAGSSETFESVFWNLRKPGSPKVRYRGFVGYGTAGRKGFNPKDAVCTVGERNVCMDFFLERYRAIVRSGVKALLLIETARN